MGSSLAEGGMGEIIRSTDESGRALALKTILKDYESDPHFRELFLREAEITFRLDHPNIVRAYRFEEIGKKLVLALEYLDGINMKELLRLCFSKKRLVPVSIAVAIMDRVLQGLDYAHKKKDSSGRPLHIIHRDLNPSNIFITYGGEIKVLDFGISKATSKDVHQLTPKGELRGKISYLSPEQIRDGEIDHRSDIFMAAIVTWELLAGQPLYLKSTDAEVMEAICSGEYRPLRLIRDDIPREVDEVIRKALSVHPKNRYASAEDYRQALNQALRGSSILPGTKENEISIYVRSIFNRQVLRGEKNFDAGVAWIMTQVSGLQEKGLAHLKELAANHPSLPYVQLAYARAQLSVGDRLEGLRHLRRLSRVESLEDEVQEILEWLGVRRPPVVPLFSRSNPVNKYLGLVRHKVLGPTPFQSEFLAA